MLCGWCRGEPQMIDRGALWECSSCHNILIKKAGIEVTIELHNPEDKIREMAARPIPQAPPKRKRRTKAEVELARKQQPKIKGKKGKKRTFNIADILGSGKTLYPYQVAWCKEQVKLGITCFCGEAMNPLDPDWTYHHDMWHHKCS